LLVAAFPVPRVSIHDAFRQHPWPQSAAGEFPAGFSLLVAPKMTGLGGLVVFPPPVNVAGLQPA